MCVIADLSRFMCGIYVVRFSTGEEARSFIDKYSNCPVWPVVAQGSIANEVFILAVELKDQRHGDFTQENNTLVHNPHYLGATQVRFRRDDSLLELFKNHTLKTGHSDHIPCGADCENCPTYQNPCMGCPATYPY